MSVFRLLDTGKSSASTGGSELIDAWQAQADFLIWLDIDGELTTADSVQLQEQFRPLPRALQDAARNRHPPKFERLDDHSLLLFTEARVATAWSH